MMPQSIPPPVPTSRFAESQPLSYRTPDDPTMRGMANLLLWYFIAFGGMNIVSALATLLTMLDGVPPLEITTSILRVLAWAVMIVASACLLRRLPVWWLLIVGAAMLFLLAVFGLTAWLINSGALDSVGVKAPRTPLPARYVLPNLAYWLMTMVHPIIALLAGLGWRKMPS